MADVDIKIKVDSKQAQSSINNLNKTLNKVSETSAKVAKASGVAFIGLSAGIITATKAFADFESQMRSVKTLLDETSFEDIGLSLNEGFKQLEQDTLSVINEMPIAIDAATSAMFDLVSAGVPASKATKALGVASKLAIAGVTNVSTATNGLTSALNAYGISADEADVVAGQFFLAQKAGKTTIEELSDGFGLVGSTAEAMGVSLDEVLASVSALTLGGVKTNSAFTGLKAAIANISVPTANATKEAKRLGIEFNAAALRSQGLEGFLTSLTSANGFTQDSITKLFGSVEAQGVAFALTGKQATNFSKILDSVGNSTNAVATLNAAFDEQMKTLTNQTVALTNQVKVFLITLGKEFEPILSKIVSTGAKVIGFLTSLSSSTKKTIASIVLIATAFAGIVTAVATVGAALPAIVGGFAAISAGATALAGVLPVIATTVAPIVVIIGGIVLAVDLLIKNFEFLEKVATAVAKILILGWKQVKKTFDTMILVTLDGFRDIANGVKNLNIPGISDAASKAVGILDEAIRGTILSLDETNETISELGNSIETDLNGAIANFDFGLLGDLSDGAFEIAEGFSESTAQANILNDTLGDVKTSADELNKSLDATGKKPIVGGAPAAGAAPVTQAAAGAAGITVGVTGGEEAGEAAGSAFGKFLKETITKFATSLLEGAKGAADAVTSTFGGLADLLVPGIGGAVTQILDQVLALGPEGIRKMIPEFINALPEIIEALAEGLVVVAEILPEALIDGLLIKGGLERIIVALIQATPRIAFKLVESIVVGIGNAAAALGSRIGKEISKAFTFGDLPEFKFPDLPEFSFPELPGFEFPSIPEPAWVRDLKGLTGGSGGGTLRKLGKSLGFQKGGLVPSGFPSDSFNADLTSGELVTPPQTTDRLFDLIEALADRMATTDVEQPIAEAEPTEQLLSINLKIGEQELAKTLLNLNRQGFRTA